MPKALPYPRRGDSSWIDDAACRGVPSKTFFGRSHRSIRQAKTWCTGCAVRAECLQAALAVEDLAVRKNYGVRGGLTWEERIPLLEALAKRCDPGRVKAALAGREIHLSPREAAVVTYTLAASDMSLDELAWRLSLTVDQAKKLRASRNDDDEHPLDASVDADVTEVWDEPDDEALQAIEHEQTEAAQQVGEVLTFPDRPRRPGTSAAA